MSVDKCLKPSRFLSLCFTYNVFSEAESSLKTFHFHFDICLDPKTTTSNFIEIIPRFNLELNLVIF